MAASNAYDETATTLGAFDATAASLGWYDKDLGPEAAAALVIPRIVMAPPAPPPNQ